MTISYTPKDAIIDLVALALIVAPEPATTAIGLSLLLRNRGSSAQSQITHPHTSLPEYQYRVDTIRGRKITWEVRTILPGQLPLPDLNKPSVKIKPREQLIYPATASHSSAWGTTNEKLPPGVKVHHTIFRAQSLELPPKNVFIPGQTIHHTIREFPRVSAVINKKVESNTIHHTIENSPGYIKAKSEGIRVSEPKIIHHTIQNSPAMQHGNPANITRPVRIIQHHTINESPNININGRLIRLPATGVNRPTIYKK